MSIASLWYYYIHSKKNNALYYTCICLLSGTHDIQNISVTSPQPGEVRVTGDFIDGSTATGLLIIIYSLTNDSDVHYITGGSTSQQPRNVHVSVPGLADGEYSISVFVVEENGLPFERVATSPKLVTVETSKIVLINDFFNVYIYLKTFR